MKTPLIILAILFAPTILAAAVGHWSRRPELYRIGGLFSLSAAFVFFGVGHFVMTDDMIAMLPDWLPAREALVLATGVLEFLLAGMLLLPSLRRRAGALCMIVLVLFFSANIFAALQHTGPGGHQLGPVYLAIRAPLQALLLAWTFWFAVRPQGVGT